MFPIGVNEAPVDRVLFRCGRSENQRVRFVESGDVGALNKGQSLRRRTLTLTVDLKKHASSAVHPHRVFFLMK